MYVSIVRGADERNVAFRSPGNSCGVLCRVLPGKLAADLFGEMQRDMPAPRRLAMNIVVIKRLRNCLFDGLAEEGGRRQSGKCQLHWPRRRCRYGEREISSVRRKRPDQQRSRAAEGTQRNLAKGRSQAQC